MRNILLFDDDCGVCTKFAGLLSRLLTLPIIPMHSENVMERGIQLLGAQNYWQSFHMISNNKWTSEAEAIITLSREFPLGNLLSRIISLTPVIWMAMRVLRYFQYQRKLECSLI